jgi:hypothetical protein
MGSSREYMANEKSAQNIVKFQLAIQINRRHALTPDTIRNKTYEVNTPVGLPVTSL